MPGAYMYQHTMQRTEIVTKAWQYAFVRLSDVQTRNKTECGPASSETVAQGDYSREAFLFSDV